METVAQPLRPTWAHLAATFIVLATCELAMAGCWISIVAFLRAVPDASHLIVPGITLMSLAIAWTACRQYQATFQQNRRAASVITGVLIGIGVFISIAFLDATSMNARTGRFDRGWYVLLAIFVTLWFTVIMNWKWANRLRSSAANAASYRPQLSIANMLGLMTLLALQFALAALFLRLSPR